MCQQTGCSPHRVAFPQAKGLDCPAEKCLQHLRPQGQRRSHQKELVSQTEQSGSHVSMMSQIVTLQGKHQGLIAP